jgi:hypothetical protein
VVFVARLVQVGPGTGDAAAPIVAPQIPNAVPRSRPWNSWANSASAVANMIAPPIPCTPRAMIRKRESFAAPQRVEAIVNRITPITNSRLRPKMSASAPAVSTQVARASA